MKSYKIFLILSVVFLFLSACNIKSQNKPKLVVGIVVDQMRYDYLTRFANYFGNDGFKRLMNDGSFFTNAHFNYVPTYTAPGHASIYTGTTPYYHGIISNNWYDRIEHKVIYCAGDSTVKTVGAGDDLGEMSPRRLLSKTVTDQLKIFTNGNSKIISISIKDRAAILPGGHSADAVYWYDGNNGKFISSTYYMKQLPDWVNNFNKKNLSGKYMSQSWALSLPKENYKNSFPDETPWEADVFSEGKTTFPHEFNKLKDVDKYEALCSTPFGNQIIVDLAKEVLDNEKLGTYEDTDFLAISFSSTDYIGHEYGPTSVEIMDTYIKLDEQLGELLNYLDKKTGKGNYLLFLSADHGGAEPEGYLKERNLPSGALGYKRSLDSLRSFAAREFGDTTIVENYTNNQVFLNYKFIADKNLKLPEVQNKFSDYLQKTFPEIAKVYMREGLKNLSRLRDGNNFTLNGFNIVRSGDVAFELQPGYLVDHLDGIAATHGTRYSYDTHIPVIFYGGHVPKQKSNEPVYIVDIAPTIASLLGITEPDCSIGIPLIK